MDKLKITGLEGNGKGVAVVAQFNPKEISVDKTVPWQQQKKKGAADLEFSGGQSMTMAVELLFDGFESGGHIQNDIDKLQLFSNLDKALKRPPRVSVIFGQEGSPGMLPKFQSVIESLTIRYTMFDGNGVPLRATVGLRFKEALNVAVTA